MIAYDWFLLFIPVLPNAYLSLALDEQVIEFFFFLMFYHSRRILGEFIRKYGFRLIALFSSGLQVLPECLSVQ